MADGSPPRRHGRRAPTSSGPASRASGSTSRASSSRSLLLLGAGAHARSSSSSCSSTWSPAAGSVLADAPRRLPHRRRCASLPDEAGRLPGPARLVLDRRLRRRARLPARDRRRHLPRGVRPQEPAHPLHRRQHPQPGRRARRSSTASSASPSSSRRWATSPAGRTRDRRPASRWPSSCCPIVIITVGRGDPGRARQPPRGRLRRRAPPAGRSSAATSCPTPRPASSPAPCCRWPGPSARPRR